MPDPATFLASNLLPGRLYRVRRPFTDADKTTHPAGEIWRFTRGEFSPHDSLLTLQADLNGRPAVIRLDWGPTTQGLVIEHFSDFADLLPEPSPNHTSAFDTATLQAGAAYRVRAPFHDFDDQLHPVGETWVFERMDYLPYHSGMSLFVSQDGALRQIRLQWMPEAQAAIIDDFSDYIERLPGILRSAAAPAPAKPGFKIPLWGKLTFSVGIGLATAAVVVVCLFLVAFGVLEYLMAYRTPQDYHPILVSSAVEAPGRVTLNQNFDMTLSLASTDPQPKTLESLDLPEAYLQGVSVQGSQPPFSSAASLDEQIDGFPRYTRYTYHLPIPTGGRLVITLHLTAVKTGYFSGQALVCTTLVPSECTIQFLNLSVQ